MPRFRARFPGLRNTLKRLDKEQRATLLLRIAKLWGENARVEFCDDGYRTRKTVRLDRQPLRCHYEPKTRGSRDDD